MMVNTVSPQDSDNSYSIYKKLRLGFNSNSMNTYINAVHDPDAKFDIETCIVFKWASCNEIFSRWFWGETKTAHHTNPVKSSFANLVAA
jgi:hypothetical protein